MAFLEELAPDAQVRGLLPAATMSIISARQHGSVGVEVVYRDADGLPGSELLYQDVIANLEMVPADLPWR